MCSVPMVTKFSIQSKRLMPRSAHPAMINFATMIKKTISRDHFECFRKFLEEMFGIKGPNAHNAIAKLPQPVWLKSFRFRRVHRFSIFLLAKTQSSKMWKEGRRSREQHRHHAPRHKMRKDKDETGDEEEAEGRTRQPEAENQESEVSKLGYHVSRLSKEVDRLGRMVSSQGNLVRQLVNDNVQLHRENESLKLQILAFSSSQDLMQRHHLHEPVSVVPTPVDTAPVFPSFTEMIRAVQHSTQYSE